MFRLLFLLIFFYNFIVFAQDSTALIGKCFEAKIGSVCMETSVDDPCAGDKLFLSVVFKKNQVDIYEKSISSCGVVRRFKLGSYPYDFFDDKIIIDYSKSKTYHVKLYSLDLIGFSGDVILENGKRKMYDFVPVKF